MTNTVTTAKKRMKKDTAADAYVGERVHAIMWRKKIDHKSIYEAVGLSRSSLAKKMRGTTGWSIGELVTVADVLGVSAADLLPPTSSAGAAIRAMPGGEELVANAQRNTGPASATDAGAFVTGE